MKKIKKLLAFAFNEESGIICSFIVVLSIAAFLWFIPICVLPCEYFNPTMITLCTILVALAIRLFTVVYKNY